METKTLADAVAKLLSSLDEEQKAELVSLTLNYRVAPAHDWIQHVIEMFDLADPSQELVADIERQFPDEAALKLIESDSSQPVFEAKMILRESQRNLRET